MILITYIATGDYYNYFDGFMKTINNFQPSEKKVVVVFSDRNNVCSIINNCIHIRVKIEHQHWPIVALNKFKYILKAIQIAKEDNLDITQVWNFDSKVEFKRVIKKKELNDCEDKIVLFPHTTWGNVLKSCHNDKNKAIYKYHWGRSLNPSSKAFYSFSLSNVYIQSAVFGGNVSLIEEMCKELDNCVAYDLMHCIIPMWHDESYINMYYNTHTELISLMPFGEEALMGEYDNENCDNRTAPINFRNTDNIQKFKQTVYNGDL